METIARELAAIITNRAEDPGVRLAAMKFFLQHAKDSLKFSGIVRVLEQKLTETTEGARLETVARELSLVDGAATRTEDLLAARVRGVPQRGLPMLESTYAEK